MKPTKNRVILKVEKLIKKNPDGQEVTDISREGKVVESADPEFKKGMVVYYNPYGGIEMEYLTTKKHIVLIIDSDDIYAIL